MAVKPIPDGRHRVTTYLVVPGVPKLIDFMKEVFGAQELRRTTAPGGRVVHAEVKIGDSVIMLGEPTGVKSDRVAVLGEIITSVGLKAPIRKKIRDDIWFKLLGNTSFNPISVLTHATLEQMGQDEGVRDVIRQTMIEARDVALKLGVKFSMDIEIRIDAGVDVGAHKTSMLQDFEQGRPLELDALVASVSEMGRLVDVPTPTIDAMLALVQLRVSVDA